MSSHSAANPSSSSIVPPRASFSHLPLEIVKHIIELVSQDRSSYGGVKRGSYEKQARWTSTSWMREDDSKTSVATSWSCWYGREMESLSRVNSRLRKLCMPHLVKHTTSAHLAKPYALYRLSTFPYASSIQYLSLSLPPKEAVPFIDIAPLFPLLTGIHSLSLNSRSLIRLYRARPQVDPSMNARRDLTIEALEDLGRKIRHLSISALPQDDFLTDIIPRIASMSDLQHLSIDGNLSAFWYGETSAAGTFRKYLREFSSLDSFEAEDCDWDDGEFDVWHPFSSLWREALSLPSVRRIKLATPAAPFVVMPAMSATFPHAERVSIIFNPPDFENSDEERYCDDVDSVEWTRLRSFSLEGDACIFPTVIASLAPCSQLAHLHLEPNNVAALENVFPEHLSPNLRRVTFHNPFGHCIFSLPHDECRDWCSKRGVAVDWLSWRSAPKGILPFASHHEQGAPTDLSANSTTKDTLYEVLDWARRRINHLRSTNDEPGFEEMKQALLPLRERQYIERGRTFVDLDAVVW